jgi:hypothetical protein
VSTTAGFHLMHHAGTPKEYFSSITCYNFQSAMITLVDLPYLKDVFLGGCMC